MDELAAAGFALFEAMSDLVVLLEVLGDEDDVLVVAANQAATDAIGEGVSLPGRRGSELYTHSDLADVVGRARQVLATGEPLTYQAVRELAEGRRVAAATMIPVGASSRVVVHGRDISDQVESYRRLAELEELAEIGSWQWNIRDDVVTWSPQYRRIVGATPGEPASMARSLELVHPDDRRLVAERVDLVSRGADRPRGLTYRIVRPDGEERVVQARGEVVAGDDGRPLRMFGTTQDVTEERRAEADRQRLEAALTDQRRAIELNDNVVQGLCAAWLAFELDRVEEGIALVRRTTRDAQQLVTGLLTGAASDGGPFAPGDLARVAPANPASVAGERPDPAGAT
ncbi:PAS domain-containing protein [Egicoccus halophilus]|uniref:histidine kinase n=1 Tax=Egicoccus halophilus TaxID=1670830 RepID=A0A8J3A674_9ACTN|nr:PAS domain-containing protein [Egicoccus halophilus]GGI04248.1 hypothetical protein GCM10011354_08160 [Egicoccus halophilus]